MQAYSGYYGYYGAQGYNYGVPAPSNYVTSAPPYMYGAYPATNSATTTTTSNSNYGSTSSNNPYGSISSNSTYGSASSNSYGSASSYPNSYAAQNNTQAWVTSPQAKTSTEQQTKSRWGNTNTTFVSGSSQPFVSGTSQPFVSGTSQSMKVDSTAATTTVQPSFAQVVKEQATRSRASKWGAKSTAPSASWGASSSAFPPNPFPSAASSFSPAVPASAPSPSSSMQQQSRSAAASAVSATSPTAISMQQARAAAMAAAMKVSTQSATGGTAPGNAHTTTNNSSSSSNNNNNSNSKSNWAMSYPPDLIKFVEDSLSAARGSMRQEVEAWLKKRIERAHHRGELLDTDWASEPLAHIAVQQEKQARRSKASSSPKGEEDETPWWLGGTGGLQGLDPAKPSKSSSSSKRKKRPSSTGGGTGDTGCAQSGLSSPRAAAGGTGGGWSGQPPDGPKVKKKSKQAAAAEAAAAALSGMEVDHNELHRRGSRMHRFKDSLGKVHEAPQHVYRFGKDAHDQEELDWESLKIVGTSTSLEKKYLRITTAPDPSTVRPVPVLRKTLAMLKEKWEQAPGQNYKYLGEQFKSLRQDLTVQNVRTNFTVDAYETHARVCLTMGDFSEYNQCQTQLKTFYDESAAFRTHVEEFLVYRVLYCLMVGKTPPLVKLLRDLSIADRKRPPVAYVLRIREALALKNYHAFFHLYPDTPYMGKCFLDVMLPSLRVRALETMCYSYKPKIPLDFLTTELRMEDVEACREFVLACGGVLTPNGEALDTKTTKHVSAPEEVKFANGESDVVHGAFTHT
eukprot:g13494.t1